jgi:aldehyde:ferredoxin oxidoreductase
LNDDLELVTACHDACNRYGIDAVSSSATLGWVCEAVERGLLTKPTTSTASTCAGATARRRSR